MEMARAKAWVYGVASAGAALWRRLGHLPTTVSHGERGRGLFPAGSRRPLQQTYLKLF